MDNDKPESEAQKQDCKNSGAAPCYTTYLVEYWAWPEGARIETKGRFKMAGNSKEDVMSAAKARWPEMNITRCEAT